MSVKIASPIIALISEYLPELESHASIDNLFGYADAPGDPPEGSKPVKVQAWMRRINKECEEPLTILGLLIEQYIEIDADSLPDVWPNWNSGSAEKVEDPRKTFKKKIIDALARQNLNYVEGGRITTASSTSSKSLAELIKDRDLPSIDFEFQRALDAVNSNPREAVSAACNVLESVFKVYIEDERLKMPKKQDLQSVWKIVRANLGLDTGSLEDEDLKRIVSGILSVVDGIGALRTHASTAHGRGRKTYIIKARHARLAVHSAHTLAVFIIETWDEQRQATTLPS